MDSKKSPNSRRSKRQGKQIDDNVWDCSVCTYRNTAEAFKCLMCDVRKGTSTRKPRINPQLVAQQVAQQQFTQSPNPLPKQPKIAGSKFEKKGLSPDNDLKSEKNKRPRLRNIDRSSAQHKAVTVNNVTVIITEFQPKRRSSTDGSNFAYDSSSNHSDTASSSGASETKQIDESKVT